MLNLLCKQDRTHDLLALVSLVWLGLQACTTRAKFQLLLPLSLNQLQKCKAVGLHLILVNLCALKPDTQECSVKIHQMHCVHLLFQPMLLEFYVVLDKDPGTVAMVTSKIN